MIRVFQIVLLSCATLLLTGCNSSEETDAFWHKVKIGDLVPPHDADRPASLLLKTISFNNYIFEIPAENIDILDNIWPMLYTKPLRLNDADAFKANFFSAGFGQVQMWDKIRDLLFAANAKKTETTSLLLSDGHTSDIVVAELDSEQTIFYISTSGSMEGTTIGPGILALRIKAEKVPGSRGVCEVDAKPVFPSPIRTQIPRLAPREKFGEFLFTSAGFKLKMSPGDFVILGPEKYISHQITLGSLFFSRPKPKPVVRVFLFVCTGIID
jgi:hypothetical protein